MNHITSPTKIKAPGEPPKIIQEFIGLLSNKTEELSIAKMDSPAGWSEPWQVCDFNEYIFVIKGIMLVETESGSTRVYTNQAIQIQKGERVRYSTPYEEGAEYIAICCPAFSIEKVKRE